MTRFRPPKVWNTSQAQRTLSMLATVIIKRWPITHTHHWLLLYSSSQLQVEAVKMLCINLHIRNIYIHVLALAHEYKSNHKWSYCSFFTMHFHVDFIQIKYAMHVLPHTLTELRIFGNDLGEYMLKEGYTVYTHTS